MSQSDLTNKLLSGILDQVKKNGSISSGSRQGSSLDLDDAEKLTKQFEKQAGLLKQMNLSVQEYAERQSEYSETASQINKVMESNQNSFGKMVGLAKEMNKALGFTQRLFRPITKVLDGIKTRAKVFSDINKEFKTMRIAASSANSGFSRMGILMKGVGKIGGKIFGPIGMAIKAIGGAMISVFTNAKKKLVIVKKGDHSLSEPKWLKILIKELKLLVN